MDLNEKPHCEAVPQSSVVARSAFQRRSNPVFTRLNNNWIASSLKSAPRNDAALWNCLAIILLLFCISIFLPSCAFEDDTYAPVADISQSEQIPESGMHRVQKGETLYEIAWRFGLDYRTLAAWNNIYPPYTIQQHRLISLREYRVVPQKQGSTKIIERPQQQPAFVKMNNEDNEPDYSMGGFRWPARGKIINGFSAMNKGVNIASNSGEPILAAGPGKVVYCGNGLRGYGNLIIIKHNNLYLSAYAHCRRVFVKDGQWIKQGQKIGEMGSTGTDKIMLHFELRRAGKPINPITFFRVKTT